MTKTEIEKREESRDHYEKTVKPVWFSIVCKMPAHKGHAKAGGRVKGTPNKVTMLAREAIASFVDGNADRLTGWLDQIAVSDPKDAFNCFMSVVEYHIPKLARSEHIGDPEKPIIHKVELEDSIVEATKILEAMKKRNA